MYSFPSVSVSPVIPCRFVAADESSYSVVSSFLDSARDVMCMLTSNPILRANPLLNLSALILTCSC